MKRFLLSTAVVLAALNLFAHPGHGHSDMSEGSTFAHLLWVLVPLVIGGLVLFSKRKRKALK